MDAENARRATRAAQQALQRMRASLPPEPSGGHVLSILAVMPGNALGCMV